MKMPWRASLLLAFVFTTACGSVSEPEPISDAGPYPYRRTPSGVRTTGINRVLILPASFAGGGTPTVSPTAIRDLYFGNGSGSIASSYALASRRMFTLRGEVAAWSQSTVAAVELGTSPGLISPTREGDYVLGAIRAAESTIDFGKFDNDGPDGFPNSGDDDGLVDGGIVVMNADRDFYCDADAGRGPHPHATLLWRDATGKPFNTSDVRTGGGFIAVGGYTVLSAQACDRQSPNVTTLAHELGHLLFGLPDLYHAVGGLGQIWESRRWVVGCWELMAAGSIWGCGSGTPAFIANATKSATFGAWTRVQNGWITPPEARVTIDSMYTLTSLTNGGDGTVLRVPISATEYLLIEYREPGPSDGAPPGTGVLIYRVAEQIPLYPFITADRQYRISLIEADDDNGLRRTALEGGDRGRAEDAFGNAVTMLNPATHSQAKTAAGVPFPFLISEITLDRAQHRARLRIAPR